MKQWRIINLWARIAFLFPKKNIIQHYKTCSELKQWKLTRNNRKPLNLLNILAVEMFQTFHWYATWDVVRMINHQKREKVKINESNHQSKILPILKSDYKTVKNIRNVMRWCTHLCCLNVYNRTNRYFC